MSTSPQISVVVCTYNRAEMLRDTLASLVVQQTDGRFTFEILVVDNASTDHTPQVIEQAAAACDVVVRSVRELRQGQVHARNRGVSEARGEWIANFDDDQIADPRWLIELYSLAQSRQARSVGGVVRLKFPENCDRQLSPVCRRLLGESVGWETERPYTRKEGPGAGNQLLHRSVFQEVGLYDEAYNRRGEDTDLYRRIRAAGIESWYTPRAIAWHVTPPQRLEEAYLRATSLNNGWCFARRDQEEWGRAAMAGVVVARMGQAALLNLPRWLWAHLRRAREDALAARCLLWRLEGYLHCAARLILPNRLARN
jgi:glycosyltransferase involved in cell wall biosynthesis